MIGQGDTILIPKVCQSKEQVCCSLLLHALFDHVLYLAQVDYEVELAVVIGKTCELLQGSSNLTRFWAAAKMSAKRRRSTTCLVTLSQTMSGARSLYIYASSDRFVQRAFLANREGSFVSKLVLCKRSQSFMRSGGQWCRGKTFDTFCPLGPWITLSKAFGDPSCAAPERNSYSTVFAGKRV